MTVTIDIAYKDKTYKEKDLGLDNKDINFNEYASIVERKDVTRIDELLRKNIHPDQLKDHRGLNVLGHSIVDENYTLFNLVLRHGASCRTFKLQDGTIFHPLAQAVERNQEKMALQLLENTCEYDIQLKNKHIIYDVVDKKMWLLFRQLVNLFKDTLNDFPVPLLHYTIPNLVDIKKDRWKGETKEFIGADIIFDLLDKGANPGLKHDNKLASEMAHEYWQEFLENKKYHGALAAYIMLEKIQLGQSVSPDLLEHQDKIL